MATKYIYSRNSTRLFITVSETGKKFKINLPVQSDFIINNEKLPIQKVSGNVTDYSFLWNDKPYNCVIDQKEQNKYTVVVNGVAYKFSIETIASYLRKQLLSKEEDSGEKDLKAPMPGKIVEIFVSESEAISTGDPVFILEAMKMQSEFTSPINGVIRKLNIVPGQSVMKDELLVEIDPIQE